MSPTVVDRRVELWAVVVTAVAIPAAVALMVLQIWAWFPE